jgi:SAM-dependent methyltransferase
MEEWLGQVPAGFAGGRALDVGCGAGRNALRLAEAGYRVDAMDISRHALARGADTAADRGLSVNWIEADMDEMVPEAGAYAVISVVRFMNRAMPGRLVAALAPGGWLLFEHHLMTSRSVDGPRGDGFRLVPQELLRSFASLRVIHYSEAIADDPDGRPMALARLVACNGDPGF